MLGGLVVATALVFGGIAWDAGLIGPGDAVPASRPGGPAVAPGTGSAPSAPSATHGRANGGDSRSGGSGSGGSGGAGGSAGADGSSGGAATRPGGSGGGKSQADHARDAATRPAPRPPMTPGISQDELDRIRNSAEATVPVVTAAPPTSPSAP